MISYVCHLTKNCVCLITINLEKVTVVEFIAKFLNKPLLFFYSFMIIILFSRATLTIYWTNTISIMVM